MRLLIVFLLLFKVGDNSRLINGKGFSGYIFNKDHFILMNIENEKGRYTPSDDDIYLVENIIKNSIEKANVDLLNQGEGCPIIHKRLKKYTRQYFGFENTKGEKIIYVNFVWKDKKDKRLSKDIVIVKDGCSYYWSIKVNISQAILYDLQINGRA